MKQTKKAFSLIELIVSIFVFLILMASIVQIFAQQMNAYRYARVSQNDLENAQFAMNYVSKTLRTSSIIGTITGANSTNWRNEDSFEDFELQEINGSTTKMVIYDFSQELCMQFYFDVDSDTNSALWVKSASGIAYNEIDECLTTNTYGGPQKLTSGDVTGTFLVSPTTSFGDETKTIGRVTLGMKVLPSKLHMLYDEKEEHPIYVQTSTSLRDYPPDLSF